MKVAEDPKITEFPEDAFDYTSIQFEPDLKIFGLKSLDDDIFGLLKKRVYDLAGCSPSNVSVYFNGKKIQIGSFQKYIELYRKQENFVFDKSG